MQIFWQACQISDKISTGMQLQIFEWVPKILILPLSVPNFAFCWKLTTTTKFSISTNFGRGHLLLAPVPRFFGLDAAEGGF